MPDKNQLRVFLSHAKEDKSIAKELYKRLREDGIDAWLDEENLLPGEEWKPVIKNAIKESHVVLVLLSKNSILKTGYFQSEIRMALEFADEQPQGAIYIIPVKLEECDVPDKFKHWQYLEYYKTESYKRLCNSLLAKAKSVGITISQLEIPSSDLVLDVKTKNSVAHLYRFQSNNGPHGLLFDQNKLFVANWEGANITILNAEDKTIIGTIELDLYEFINHSDNLNTTETRHYVPGNSMVVVKNKLFIGQVFSDVILVINIEKRLIVKRIYVPSGGEGVFSVSPNEDKVYFASNNVKVPLVFVIDTVTYEFEAIPYPGEGRGCLCLLAHPNNQTLYLGIQRGRNFGGGGFLAVYNLQSKTYISLIYLAELVPHEIFGSISDDSLPHRLTLDPVYPILYIGMFQSNKGIYSLDTSTNKIIGNFSFKPNSYNKYYTWVNPIAQVIYKDYLLSVNQSNYQLVIINRITKRYIKSIHLGKGENGPTDIVVVGDIAIISYPKKNGLIYIDLKKVLKQ